MKTWFAWVGAMAVLGQSALGCSSSPSSSDDVEQPQVRGAYRATNEGQIRTINFYDANRYVSWRACASGEQPAAGSTDCKDSGAYALNAARTELSLTNDATGKTTAMPFKVLAMDAASNGGTLTPKALHTQDLGGAGGGLVQGDGALVQSQGPLISSFNAGLVNFQSDSRNGVDYSWGRPSPSGLRSAGYTFAARYLSGDSSKNITASEAQALTAAGVDIVSNWEYGQYDTLDGYDGGVRDATQAQSQAAAAGMPGDRPIYFSVDFDASEGQQDTINAYFDGAASVIGQGRVGAYGGYYVIKRLFDAGKISWGWQAFAWSGGQWDSRAQLRQIQNGVSIAGADCDIDQSQAADFGQWSYGGAGGGGGGGGDCSVHDDGKLYCPNSADAAIRATPTNNGDVVNHLRSTTSWFDCWSSGDLHAGGNTTWYHTLGDDNGNWGWVAGVDLSTPDDFDSDPSAHGLKKCN